MRALRAVCRLCAFALCCLLVIPTQGMVLLFRRRGPVAYCLPHIWHSVMCSIFGIRLQITGQPAIDKHVLYMSNHLSYLDIPALGRLLKCSFVAKSEVETWPLFGFLATLQQTAFIQRKREAARRQKTMLQNRIASGESLIIFPEGTSTDGRTVYPFKSSLFALAFDEDAPDLHIQPMTIRILEVDGQHPDTQDLRDIYAWHIDMDTGLGAHLWRFAKSRGCRLQIHFHAPLYPRDYADRKALAAACQEKVARGLDLPVAAA